jgi:hypothetical protein
MIEEKAPPYRYKLTCLEVSQTVRLLWKVTQTDSQTVVAEGNQVSQTVVVELKSHVRTQVSQTEVTNCEVSHKRTRYSSLLWILIQSCRGFHCSARLGKP